MHAELPAAGAAQRFLTQILLENHVPGHCSRDFHLGLEIPSYMACTACADRVGVVPVAGENAPAETRSVVSDGKTSYFLLKLSDSAVGASARASPLQSARRRVVGSSASPGQHTLGVKPSTLQ